MLADGEAGQQARTSGGGSLPAFIKNHPWLTVNLVLFAVWLAAWHPRTGMGWFAAVIGFWFIIGMIIGVKGALDSSNEPVTRQDDTTRRTLSYDEASSLLLRSGVQDPDAVLAEICSQDSRQLGYRVLGGQYLKAAFGSGDRFELD
jgi:hypothetical protein